MTAARRRCVGCRRMVRVAHGRGACSRPAPGACVQSVDWETRRGNCARCERHQSALWASHRTGAEGLCYWISWPPLEPRLPDDEKLYLYLLLNWNCYLLNISITDHRLSIEKSSIHPSFYSIQYRGDIIGQETGIKSWWTLSEGCGSRTNNILQNICHKQTVTPWLF